MIVTMVLIASLNVAIFIEHFVSFMKCDEPITILLVLCALYSAHQLNHIETKYGMVVNGRSYAREIING